MTRRQACRPFPSTAPAAPAYPPAARRVVPSVIPGTVFFDMHQDNTVDAGPSLTGDELTMFYRSNRGGSYGIWMVTRPSITDTYGDYVEFSNPVEVAELNGGDLTWNPCILPDGLTIYFGAIRDGHSTFDLYRATRGSVSDPFENIERLSLSTDSYNERDIYVTPDESAIYFSDERGIWLATIPEPSTILLLGTSILLLRYKNKS